ncbi:MAG: hypothetical protein EBR30_24030 [Cytophagia bacterium]|jgi:hypothetical protein|nr:hypothetical protein [Cytophagia bacterium]
MKYNIGDLLLWKTTEELSTIISTWTDYDKKLYYIIEMYNEQYYKYYTDTVSEERIEILIEYGSVIHYPVKK